MMTRLIRESLRGSRLAISDSIILGMVLFLLLSGADMAYALRPTEGVRRTGFLSAYDKEPTDDTIYNRIRWEQIPNDTSAYDLLIAVLDCDRVGQEAQLKTVAGTFDALVFDCAGVADGGRDWMLDGNYVAEVDYYFRLAHPELIGTQATLIYEASGFTLPDSVLFSWLKPPFLQPTSSGVGGLYADQFWTTQAMHGLAGWRGVDIKAGCGAALYNPLPGLATVTYNGLDGYVGPYANGQQNTMLTLRSGDYELTLLHGRYLPAVGKQLVKGEPIGFEASIGNSTGCHSHVVLRHQGRTVNYLDYLGS